jgi:hypothetical protein
MHPGADLNYPLVASFFTGYLLNLFESPSIYISLCARAPQPDISARVRHAWILPCTTAQKSPKLASLQMDIYGHASRQVNGMGSHRMSN